MTENIRRERIERLLHELEYECVRGMMQGEIEEEFYFRFIVPVSKNIKDGIVQCEFRSRPTTRYMASLDDRESRLKLVERSTKGEQQ